MDYVIIGCGASGLMAAKTIRENDQDSDITLISSDLWPFYLKPVLADYIADQIDITRMAYFSADKIERLRIKVISGKRVRSIIPADNAIRFSDNSLYHYQYLLIATGSRPVVPADKYELLSSFQVLNSLSDAVRIKNQVLRSNKALVYGGGHNALEVLRAFHALKLDLAFLTDEEMFWESDHPVPPDQVRTKLVQEKIDVHFDKDIVDIIDLDGESYRVITRDGVLFDTQLLVYTPRMEPNLDFVRGSGIEIDRGILVREDLRTSVPNVFACGDVAQFYDLNHKTNRINFGWTSASKQGQTAGLNMIGRDTVFISAKEEYFRQLYGKELLTRW